MMRRRSPFGVFLMLGFGLLLGAALFGGAGAVGSVVAAPFLVLGFMFKIVLFFMLFGLIAKMFAGSAGRGRRSRNWSGPRQEWWSEEARSRWPGHTESSENPRGKSQDDRFEEWHRMAHARQEVDDYTPPMEE